VAVTEDKRTRKGEKKTGCFIRVMIINERAPPAAAGGALSITVGLI
jgi:hypothetical protein